MPDTGPSDEIKRLQMLPIARKASQIICTDVVYATFLAAWLLHEVPSIRTIIGAAIIMLVGLMQSKPHTT